jgi:creatinine amidohydrolase
MKLRFENMSWMDVAAYLERDDRVVVTTGACEQHGYMSLLTDIRIPMELAQVACTREEVLLAPPLNFGISPYFDAYPGTLSLRPATFLQVVREVIEGLLAHGFRRVLVNNGHGGNIGLLKPLLVELGNAHPDARFAQFEWWHHPAVEAVAEEAGLPLGHGNWMESFACTRVGPLPEEEKEPLSIGPTDPAPVVRRTLGDGSFGGPYQAPPAVEQRLFDAAADALTEALRAL